MRVAAFGQRAGLLKDTKLVDAIQAVKAEDDPDWSNPAVKRLQEALNAAAIMIRPVTIVDLKRWDPFAERQQGFTRYDALRWVYVILAILMISVAIHYTQWLSRAEAVVKIQDQNLAGQLDRMLQEINDSFLTSPDAAIEALSDTVGGPARDALREKLREAKILADARWAAHREYNLINQRFYMLWDVVLNGNLSAIRKDFDSFSARMKALPTVPPISVDPNPCRTTATKMRAHVLEAQLAVATALATSGTTGVAPKQTLSQAVDRMDTRVSEDRIGETTLRCLVNADRATSGVSYDEAELKQKIETVGLWLLPALFGAFGAVVHHLRACWNRLRPDPRFGRAMLRIFLGAFGGISFGWFWSPGTDGDVLRETLPLGAFAVAFLIGYSIDIFFALLDKLVATMSGAIERIGSDAQTS